MLLGRMVSSIIVQEITMFLTKIFLLLVNTQEFAQDFLEDKLTPSYKSDPVPESVSREELSVNYFLYHYLHDNKTFSVFPCRMMRMSKLLLARV